jgi:cell division protein FtsB
VPTDEAIGQEAIEMTDNWEEVYKLAALEVDKARMVERLSAARQAIQRRVNDLDQSNEHHDERTRMGIALMNLKSLEDDSQTWS